MLQIIESKKYFYSCQLTRIIRQLIDYTSQACDFFSLPEHRIVLSQTEQFDVLDLYKTHIQEVLSYVLFRDN